MRREFCIGAMALPGHEHWSLGPRHPSESGLVSGIGEIVDGHWHEVRLTAGYGHRAAEKLFEVRDFRTAIMLADRHDWLSAFSGELSIAMAIEQAMRLSVPPRARALRTVLAELARIHSHLSFLSYPAGPETQARLWDVVEGIRRALLEWSGNRVHPMLNRVGGLAADVPDGWAPPLGEVERVADLLEAELAATDRFRSVAVLDRDACLRYGLSGPVARAAGLELDRRRSGYLAYDDLFVAAPLRSEGDGHARLGVLIDELRTSSQMIREAMRLAGGASGEIGVRLARRLKVPEGEHWAELEAPWGIAAAFLVSRGGPTPWRLALRTPSFVNLQALGPALEGTPETAIADAIATVGYTVGDADK